MRIERPRSPQMVEVKGRLRPKVGYAQMQMLRLIASLGRGEPPPKGKLTATGVLREHIARDLIPLDMVGIHVRKAGFADYYLTKFGRDVIKNGIVSRAPKTQSRTLLERQRSRASGRQASKVRRRKTA